MTIPHPGTLAPAFQSRNQFAQPVSLAGLRGRPLLLVFFPYAFTAVCSGELRALRDRRDDITAQGCRVVAVSTDTTFTLRALDEAESLDFPLLTDHWPHGEIARAYGVFDESMGCARRVTFLIDADGIVQWHHSSDLPVPRDVSAPLQALREMLES